MPMCTQPDATTLGPTNFSSSLLDHNVLHELRIDKSEGDLLIGSLDGGMALLSFLPL